MFIDNMETYGSIIKVQGTVLELNRLCEQLMKINPKRPGLIVSYTDILLIINF